MQPNVSVYILQCADGSYYVGKYQGWDLGDRVTEHNSAVYPDAYTARRRPVKLVWSSWFPRFDDAVAFERQLKGWNRAKKEALIRGDEAALRAYSVRGFRPSQAAFALRDASAIAAAPQGEGSLDAQKSHHPEEASSAVTKGEGLQTGKLICR
ncbi:MAG: GIY-YIG nuclease family protein [Parvularculaceae bacterium]|nr:GIY-YIG nuclease family protein [Parvularculaceae bacterium]